MKISIIIPTYNEMGNIQNLLKYLKSELHNYPDCEVLVIDGESDDDTLGKTKELGFKVYQTTKGRGNQLHYGAQFASGDVLYFLHADSIPPKNFMKIINSKVKAGVEAGCFLLSFYPSNRVLRFYESFVRYRFIVCRGGDQSLFITNKLYEKIGGFNSQLKIMEDIDFIKRLNKFSKLEILQERIMTSSTKYQKNGMIRLQLLFSMLHLLFWLGASSNILLYFYNKTVK